MRGSIKYSSMRFLQFRSDTENEDRIQNDISKNTNIVKDKKRKKKSGSGAKSREKSSNRRKKADDDIELATMESKDSNIARF